jgi:hypothetical protein
MDFYRIFAILISLLIGLVWFALVPIIYEEFDTSASVSSPSLTSKSHGLTSLGAIELSGIASLPTLDSSSPAIGYGNLVLGREEKMRGYVEISRRITKKSYAGIESREMFTGDLLLEGRWTRNLMVITSHSVDTLRREYEMMRLLESTGATLREFTLTTVRIGKNTRAVSLVAEPFQESLSDLILKTGRLSPREALDVLIAVLEGLRKMHLADFALNNLSIRSILLLEGLTGIRFGGLGSVESFASDNELESYDGPAPMDADIDSFIRLIGKLLTGDDFSNYLDVVDITLDHLGRNPFMNIGLSSIDRNLVEDFFSAAVLRLALHNDNPIHEYDSVLENFSEARNLLPL